jgi:hypothetical protein
VRTLPHSTFLDIIISGLIGLRAAFGDLFVVEPLADDSIEYFALDNVACERAPLALLSCVDGLTECFLVLGSLAHSEAVGG